MDISQILFNKEKNMLSECIERKLVSLRFRLSVSKAAHDYVDCLKTEGAIHHVEALQEEIIKTRLRSKANNSLSVIRY
jgi:hypothetical protein